MPNDLYILNEKLEKLLGDENGLVCALREPNSHPLGAAQAIGHLLDLKALDESQLQVATNWMRNLDKKTVRLMCEIVESICEAYPDTCLYCFGQARAYVKSLSLLEARDILAKRTIAAWEKIPSA